VRRLFTLLSIALVTYLSIVVYTNRALLFSRFDEQYWKDKYEQSQWKLPLSKRAIGDDGLYLYEGYRLIRGGDPTSSNAEMPPFGKYLIGASILIFGNGYLYGFFTTVLLLVGTYVLTKSLHKKLLPALFVTLLLATDPLITNQYALTMMDALQALLLIAFLILLLSCAAINTKYRGATAIAAGVALGLFSETKLPVVTPIIGAVGLWYLWKKTGNVRLILGLLLGGIMGYLAPYAVYFAHGHTLIEWLKIQKWIISFYRHSNLTPTWGSAITVLMSGRYQNIFSREWLVASEWSPSWAIFFLASIGSGFFWISMKRRDSRWGILLGLLLAILCLYSVIPFWTRYFVLVVPLLYIGGSMLLSHLPTRHFLIIYSVLLIINVASSGSILFPSPQATANQFIYNAKHSFFTDLYEDTTKVFRKNQSREAFRRFGLLTMADGEIEHVKITPIGSPLTGRSSPQYLTATITYYTRRLGPFTQQTTIPFVLEDGRWRIPWQWSLILPNLTETTRLETTVIPARRGSILSSDKKPLAEDIDGYMVSVTPGRIDKAREDLLFSLLETVFNGHLPKVAIHQRIVGNTLSDQAIPLGVIPFSKTDPNIVTLSHFAGITLTDAPTRITHPNNVVDIGQLYNTAFEENCSSLYSTTNYDGISGVEQKKNTILKGINGGSLILKDQQGNRICTFINVPKHDGANVQP